MPVCTTEDLTLLAHQDGNRDLGPIDVDGRGRESGQALSEKTDVPRRRDLR
jgi:hypothetical protein